MSNFLWHHADEEQIIIIIHYFEYHFKFQLNKNLCILLLLFEMVERLSAAPRAIVGISFKKVTLKKNYMYNNEWMKFNRCQAKYENNKCSSFPYRCVNCFVILVCDSKWVSRYYQHAYIYTALGTSSTHPIHFDGNPLISELLFIFSYWMGLVCVIWCIWESKIDRIKSIQFERNNVIIHMHETGISIGWATVK